jgi:4-amino-4-deoxy-L-arabinose transferase-like glycosyltransferase
MIKTKLDAQKIALFSCILVCIVYYAIFIFQPYWPTKDSAQYYLLGRSLSEGKGYIDYSSPEPRQYYYYPPGYPFILSLVIRIFGDKFLFLRLANIITAGVSLFVLSNIFLKRMAQKDSFVILLFFALNPLFVKFVQVICSEPSYMLFSWLGLYYLYKGQESLNFRCILFGLLAMVAAFYSRSIGILLFFAAAVFFLIKRKYRYALLIFSVFFFICLPWLLSVIFAPGSYVCSILVRNYYEPSSGNMALADIPIRILSNIKYYIGKVSADLVFPPFLQDVTFGNPFFPLKIILGISLSFLFFKGLFLSMRKGIRLVEIYVLFYLAALLLYSFHSERFLVPIYPFLLTYLFVNFNSVRTASIKIMIIIVLTISLIAGNVHLFNSAFEHSPSYTPPYIKSLFWLRDNVPGPILVMAQDPPSVYLYSQKKSIYWSLRPYDAAGSFRELKKYKVTHVLIQHGGGLTVKGKILDNFDKYMRPIAEGYPNDCHLIYQSQEKPETVVYRINN